MMHEKIRRVLIAAAVVLTLCAACFVCGWYYAVRRTGADDTKQSAEYEAGSDNAENLAAGIGEQLEGISGEVHGARSKIDESITGVGELRTVGDRITANSKGSAEAAGRIEDGISRIESVLDEAEKADAGPDSNYDSQHPGGAD